MRFKIVNYERYMFGEDGIHPVWRNYSLEQFNKLNDKSIMQLIDLIKIDLKTYNGNYNPNEDYVDFETDEDYIGFILRWSN